MAGNSLQAVLDRVAKTSDIPAPDATRIKPKARAAKAQRVITAPKRPARGPGRADTKLIGGHFAPEVSVQLRMIAAEESTTVQNLLAEALDDLFVKKGKARIANV